MEYTIEVLSDSQIVLSQKNSLPWLFKPWVSAKLVEIRETLPTDGAEKLVVFKHVTSAHNVSDRQTRLCYEEPKNIPWLSGDNLVFDESHHTYPIVTKVLYCPEIKKEEMAISTQKRTRGTLLPPVTLQNLVSVQLPLQLKEPEEKKHHPSYHIVNVNVVKTQLPKDSWNSVQNIISE